VYLESGILLRGSAKIKINAISWPILKIVAPREKGDDPRIFPD
jgi:hypothetical protein